MFPDFLLEGRLIGDAECVSAGMVCVLDEKLAFKLFRDEERLGKSVAIGGGEYRVIGVTRHSRQIAQKDEYRAYIPLRAAGQRIAQWWRQGALTLIKRSGGSHTSIF